jgi:pyrroloquinoline quinone biosynthesis protein B
MNRIASCLICFMASFGADAADTESTRTCDVPLVVLGNAQDAGRPQLGRPNDPAWRDAALRRMATSIAVIDRRNEGSKRWLFDATPDVREQLQLLDESFPVDRYVGLDGIFITHAHIGHYAGLMHFGFEAARTDSLPVFAMPMMSEFLRNNGPWDQLVRYENISLRPLAADEPVELANGLRVTPFLVPHRREYSETVGFVIDGPSRRAVFLPDIDSWAEFEDMGTRIEELIERVDLAFIDATFYGDEMPNISQFPHPKILESMTRFAKLPEAARDKIRFIHLNHSNPALLPDSPERRSIAARGFAVAEQGETHCL